MKILFLFVLLLTSAFTLANTKTCLEAKPIYGQESRLLFLGVNHWLAVVDNDLIELANDQQVSRITYPERLRIMCGRENKVIAVTDTKVFEWRQGKLQEIALSFKGEVSRSDGVTTYSTHSRNGVTTLYVNTDGLTQKVTSQTGYSGRFYKGHYFWNNPIEGIQFVFHKGNLAKKIRTSKFDGGSLVFDHAECRNAGLYGGGGVFYTESRFGIQKTTINSVLTTFDYPKGCGEYLFLRDDLTFENGVIWSLKPGKQLSFKPIPSSCSVDHFVTNDDGSLFYRCGKRFYYKNKERTKDVFLGEASKLQITNGVTDRWLSTPKDGALYMYLPDTKAKEKQAACVVRVTPQKIVDMGCYR